MAKKILVVTHSDSADAGRVGDYLAARGYALDIRYPIGGDQLPLELADYAGTVVFGGPMSVNDVDQYPVLEDEIALIRTAISVDAPLFGICLGAQLIARAQGNAVAPSTTGQVEIGYFPMVAKPEGKALFSDNNYFYQWHQEGFELPKEAVLLASGSSYFPNQAFRIGANIYGVQFHPEVTKDIMELWMVRAAHLLPSPGAQQPDVQRANNQQYETQVGEWLDRFLDVWL